MIANATKTGASARIGASVKRTLWAFAGTKSSLVIIFTASATKWRMPISLIGPMLARFGPSRSCIIALCRRSAQVSNEASGITRARIRRAHLRPDESRTQKTQSTQVVDGVVDGAVRLTTGADIDQPLDPAKRSWIGRASRPHSAPA